MNEITFDAQLEPFKLSEKALFIKHLSKIRITDLILGDRGYGRTPILHMLTDQGAKCCIRMNTANNCRKEVRGFLESNKQEDEVFLSSNPYQYRRMNMDEYG